MSLQDDLRAVDMLRKQGFQAIDGKIMLDPVKAAAELEAQGYVKVTKCGECENWGGRKDREHLKECSVCAGWAAEGLGICYGRYIEAMDMGLMKADDFCPYGVPVVAKNATSEELRE